MTLSTATRNGLWNSLSNVVGVLISVLGSVIIVRSLTPEAFGQLSYYAWLAGLLSTLGTLGIPNALTKLGAELRGRGEARETRALGRWITFRLLIINLFLGMVVLLLALRISPDTRSYLLILVAVPVFNALSRSLSSNLWAAERYSPVALINIAALLIQFLLIGLSYLLNWSVAGYLIAWQSVSVTQAFGLLGLHYVQRRCTTGRVRTAHALAPAPAPALRRRYLAFMIPASLIVLTDAVVWQRSEVFFLARLSTLEQVGFYSLAFTLFSMFLALGWALVNSFYPAISREYGAGNWVQIREKVSESLLLACLYAAPLSWGGLATLPGLMRLVYGEAMLPALPAAYVLFAGLLPGVVAGALGLALSALDRVWNLVKINMVLAVSNIVLDIVLIPRYGALGGALANTCSQLGVIALLCWQLRALEVANLPWRPLVRLVAIGFLTAFLLPFVVQYFIPGPLGLGVAIVAAGVSYLFAVWRLGIIGHFFVPASTPLVQATPTRTST